MPLNIFIPGGLNISSSQSQPQVLPDNRTIQSFVEDYVDDYIGRFTVANHASVFFVSFLKVFNFFHKEYF